MKNPRMTPHRLSQLTIPLLLLTGFSTAAVAQAHGDAAAGRTIAETWCSGCHVVTATQAQGSSTGAPPFKAIAAQTAVTPMALSAFLQTPHHRMPDWQLSRNEIDDVSAYILSLRQPPKP